jgi:hypothetical protein
MTDACIHIANLFYLTSFIGRDMFWLRAFTCCGLVFGIIFFTTCQPTPMYGPSFWHAAFLAINLYQIHHLLGERRRLRLTSEQEAVSRTLLDGLSDEELVNTLTHALYSGGNDVELLTTGAGRELSDDEIAMRDIAFSRLSRGELINLLARRVWTSLPEPQTGWRKRVNRRAERPGSRESTRLSEASTERADSAMQRSAAAYSAAARRPVE